MRADGDDGLKIRHELVARAVVTDLLPMQRTRYRAALAVAFEDVPAVAAAHWRAANRLPEARDAALSAGRLAMAVEAPQDAIEALELVLGLPEPDGDAPPPMPDAPETGSRSDGGDRAVGDGAPDEDAWTAIAQVAAEAAYAAMRPTRAVAYAESVLASLGERRDRTAYAVLEARLGRYRVAAGDAAGATTALRKAAGVVPPQPSLARARILALLAQERMIAGAFSDSDRAASEALQIARDLGDEAEPEAIHAMTTLAVVRAWGDDPEEGVRLLRQAIDSISNAADSSASVRRHSSGIGSSVRNAERSARSGLVTISSMPLSASPAGRRRRVPRLGRCKAGARQSRRRSRAGKACQKSMLAGPTHCRRPARGRCWQR